MANNLKTYSVLIKWNDDDDEQGNYGTVVRATSYDEAEEKARADMRENHIANHCDPDATEDDIANSCEEYEHDFRGKTIFGGECQECAEGAIWKAAELEKALRDLVDNGFTAEELARRWSWSLDAVKAAKDIIAEIDGIE